MDRQYIFCKNLLIPCTCCSGPAAPKTQGGPSSERRSRSPGRGKGVKWDLFCAGCCFLGIPSGPRGPGIGRGSPTGASPGPCAGLCDPGTIWVGLNQGVHQQGRGGSYKSVLGRKGPCISHTRSAVTCSSGERAEDRETLRTHLHHRGQDPSPGQQPPDLVLRPGPLWFRPC